MIRTLRNIFKQDREKFIIPKSVQQAIPIQAVWKDGIFLVGRNKFTKTFKFVDINYAVAGREDKETMFLEYSELLNSFDSGATTKITINSRSFYFDISECMRKGHSFKDTICPDSLEFEKDYFVMGKRYGRVLYLKEYASYIKDSMIAELTDFSRNMMLNIDVIPIPTDEAVREVENRLFMCTSGKTFRAGRKRGERPCPCLGAFHKRKFRCFRT